MTILVFIPTGEKRIAEKNEWFIDNDGSVSINIYGSSEWQHPIVQRHEIEVPEGAAYFSYRFKDQDWHALSIHDNLPLPRPRKKVIHSGWVTKASVSTWAPSADSNDYIHVEWEEYE